MNPSGDRSSPKRLRRRRSRRSRSRPRRGQCPEHRSRTRSARTSCRSARRRIRRSCSTRPGTRPGSRRRGSGSRTVDQERVGLGVRLPREAALTLDLGCGWARLGRIGLARRPRESAPAIQRPSGSARPWRSGRRRGWNSWTRCRPPGSAASRSRAREGVGSSASQVVDVPRRCIVAPRRAHPSDRHGRADR